MKDSIGSGRDALKGLAILWVVFFHARLGLSGWAGGIQQLGYGGVDIFFFLTGYGLCHSLRRSPELKGYLARRLRRILPAYLPLCAVWMAVTLPKLGLSTVPMIQTVIGNLLMVGYWGNVPQMLNWYMSALIAVMLLAPFVYACLGGGRWGRALAFALSWLVGLCFLYDERLIMVSRLPVFVLGMICAMPREQNAGTVKRGVVNLLSFCTGAAVLYVSMTRFPAALLDYGMYWYPFALIVPPLCAGLGWVFSRYPRGFAPLRAVGRASFEIFLLNCGMEVYLKKAAHVDAPPVWLWGTLGSIAAGCLYHWAVEKLTARFMAQPAPSSSRESS